VIRYESEHGGCSAKTFTIMARALLVSLGEMYLGFHVGTIHASLPLYVFLKPLKEDR